MLASIGDSRMRLHSLLLSLSVVGLKCHKRPKQEKERKWKKNKMLTESEGQPTRLKVGGGRIQVTAEYAVYSTMLKIIMEGLTELIESRNLPMS